MSKGVGAGGRFDTILDSAIANELINANKVKTKVITQ